MKVRAPLAWPVAAALVCAACSGDDDAASGTAAASTAAVAQTTSPTSDTSTGSAPTTIESTTTAAPTTEAPTTTATPTTRAPTTTAPLEPTYTGIVWESAVDPARVNASGPAPTFEADGVTTTIQLLLWVPAFAPTELGRSCRERAQSQQDFEGGQLADRCLTVQGSFDVAPDVPTDENSPDASLAAGSLITLEGRQIDSVFASSAFPGTVDNGFVEQFPGGVPGSTLKFRTGSNLVGHTTHTYEVPPTEAFMPVFFE